MRRSASRTAPCSARWPVNTSGLTIDRGWLRVLGGPRLLEWRDRLETGTEIGHSEWVHWTLAGDIASFYENLRWPGWEDESSTLAGVWVAGTSTAH